MKYKPFRIYHTPYGRGHVNLTDGLPHYGRDRKPAPDITYPSIPVQRRHGIIVIASPRREESGKIVWDWEVHQKGARWYRGQWRYSNYTIAWRKGTCDTFEEAEAKVMEWYSEYMERRPD